MRNGLIMTCLFLLLPFAASPQAPGYPPHPDSRPQPGVPKGEIITATLADSHIFPGTSREYWIYVPSQYAPERPAALYVHEDGILFEAPTVFDNLIHRGEMPITIGVFVGPGRVRTQDTIASGDRVNRSFEYDQLGDRHVRFLLEELLVDVERRRTSDGRPIRLSQRAADRGIGGWSSGAIAAFTAAWERPDQFSRVFSAIGSYADIRGGDHYPALIRRHEPKRIRVYLQDGSSDLNNAWGDWWLANQSMESALLWAGYEVEHVWGEGGHDAQHPTAIFPDAMRWLWRGWPEPVGVRASNNPTLGQILLPGEEWSTIEGPEGLPKGTASGPEGRVYEIVAGRPSEGDGVWMVGRGEQRRLVARVPHASALAFSAERTFLYVAEDSTAWVHSYRILADGSLDVGQPFFRLETGAVRTIATAGMTTDSDGRLYVATDLGVQVFDRQGRLGAILAVPGGVVTGIGFGGERLDQLRVAVGTTVQRRKLSVRGASPPPLR